MKPDSTFKSFYERGAYLSKQMNSISKDKFSPNAKHHHQGLAATTGKRKKLTLVADYLTKQKAHPLINQFSLSSSKIMPNLSWNVVSGIFNAYGIKHQDEDGNSDVTEPYTKCIHKAECKNSGAKIYIHFNPQTQKWTLFKK